MRRKLFYYTISLMVGICFAYYTGKTFCLCLAALVTGLYFVYPKSNVLIKKLGLFCAAGMLLLNLTNAHFEQGYLAEQSASLSKNTQIIGTVIKIEQIEENQYRFVVKTNGERLLCSYYHAMNNPWDLLGRKISFSSKVDLPAEAGNPRCFDYRLYLKTQKIGFVTTVDTFHIESKNRNILRRWQAFVLERRELYLRVFNASNQGKGLIRGVLFGDTSQMDEQIYTDFRQNGTAHVLAVSGLHIGMLYSVYRMIYSRFHSGICTGFFFTFLLIYGTATLWSVSVTRAILLICLVLLGDLLQRRYDLLTALAAVALVVIVGNPYVIFGASFQMSFLAVVSIIFLKEPLEFIIGKALSTSIAVQIGLLPYMAYVFNYVSFIGILCNIPVVFLISIFVPVGMAGFMLYFFFDAMIPFFPRLLDGLAECILFINGLFSADGIFSFDTVSPPLWLVVMFYGLVFYAASEQARIYFGRKEWRKAMMPVVLILIAVLVAVPLGDSAFDDAELVFVDVGQGDCLHIKDERGRNILIDGGGKMNYNVGEKILKPYLLKNGFDRVDLAAATHLHTDHYLGLEQLRACFDVESELIHGKAGQKIELSEEQWLEILWPLEQDPETEDENLNSLIFMVHDRGVKTLITGDITAEGEQMLIDQYRGTGRLSADILKIAHHGSAYSTSDAFLEAVNPKVAVICVGKNNYGHPSEIVIEKLEKQGIMVFRTDLDGAVGIINRKGKISICTEKQR